VGDTGSPEAAAVFVGAATLDTIALVPRFPQPDERTVAEDIVSGGGGPAATAAVAAARLGLRAAFVGAVGDDAAGEAILDGLRRENVDVEGVEVRRGGRSGASVVVVDRSGGTRAICTLPVPPPEVPAGSAAADRIRSVPWVHVDHLGWGPVSRIVQALPPAERPRLSVDAGNPIQGFSPRGVDLFVPTVAALVRMYGERPVDELLDSALRAGARWVVATAGDQGSVAASDRGDRAEAPGHPVDVVSTVGAGDVFHGALLAAVARGAEPSACLRYANAAAALSCRGADGRSAIPDHHGVQAALAVPAA